MILLFYELHYKNLFYRMTLLKLTTLLKDVFVIKSVTVTISMAIQYYSYHEEIINHHHRLEQVCVKYAADKVTNFNM